MAAELLNWYRLIIHEYYAVCNSVDGKLSQKCSHETGS